MPVLGKHTKKKQCHPFEESGSSAGKKNFPHCMEPKRIIIIVMNDHFLLSQVNTWCVQVLRSPKEAFAAAMQSWSERCEKCVCLQGDYVEK